MVAQKVKALSHFKIICGTILQNRFGSRLDGTESHFFNFSHGQCIYCG